MVIFASKMFCNLVLLRGPAGQLFDLYPNYLSLIDTSDRLGFTIMLFIYWILVILMLIGVVGAVVPGVPGASLILLGITIWGALRGFTNIKWALGAAIAVLVVSIAVDAIATYWGAKQVGASKWGQIGAIVGFILGFFGLLPALPFGGPLVGILFGPLIGAVIGEFFYRRNVELKQRVKLSLKAAIGIVMGTVVGNLIQGILAIASVATFLITTWPPVGSLG